MSENSKDAWGEFWARQQAGSGGGCLPDGWRGIDAVQRRAWQTFAETLPRDGTVLDLATGDGRVMRWMREVRPDLRCIGVDLAPALPPAPEGTEVHPGVGMEDLPFEAAAFDAVVSQFGFEYGDPAKVTAEIARVLKPEGVAALMTHRSDGPILAHNKARRMHIGWAIERKDVFGLARRSLSDRAANTAAVAAQVARIVEEGAHRFGPQSAAWEIPEAVRRTLLAPMHVPAAQVESTLAQIEHQAANEMGRIASLEAACATAADDDALAAAFAAAALNQTAGEPLSDDHYPSPFADFRTYSLTR